MATRASILNELPIERAYQLVTGASTANARRRGAEVEVQCPDPAHEDVHASCNLNVEKNGWTCRSCHAGGGIFDLPVVAGHARDRAGAARWFEQRLGIVHSNIAKARVVASFVYDDGRQKPVARVDRVEPGRGGRGKEFLPYLHDGDGWAKRAGLNGRVLPIYRRGEVLEATRAGRTIYLVEGEGKGDKLRAALRSAGVAAAVTTIAGGAKAKLQPEHLADLGGAGAVVVLPDADEVGRSAARRRADAIAHAHSRIDVRIVDLYPGSDSKLDIADWLMDGHDVSELIALVADAQPYAAAANAITQTSVGSEDASRIALDITHVDLSVATRAAIAALVQRNSPPRLFTRSTQIVRLDYDRKGRLGIRNADAKVVRRELAEAVRCYRTNANAQVDAPPPLCLVENIMATPGIDLPELRGVVHAPYFTSSGRAVTTAGYDPNSELMLVLGDDLIGLAISSTPSRPEVTAAIEMIDDLLADFPLVSDADRAHAFGILLLPFVRELVEGPTPLHLVDSPKAGSGKGLLVSTLLHPSSGCVAMLGPGRDEDEWRKRITSLLVAGHGYAVFDNIPGRLDSAPLASVLTVRDWEDRILGATQQVRLPNRVTWCATGNNLKLSDEMTRRSLLIRLDAGVERPEDRTDFRHPDLLSYVTRNRAAIVIAAMTIVQSWIAEGRPAGDRTLGSFESWANVIGGILKTAGVTGFLENRSRLYVDSNEEASLWHPFVDLWAMRFGSKDTIVSNLVATAEEADIDLGTGDDKSRSTKLGLKLKGIRDRVFGGWKVERRSTISGKTQWGLRPAAGGPVGRGGRCPTNLSTHAMTRASDKYAPPHVNGAGPEASTTSNTSTTRVEPIESDADIVNEIIS